VPEKAAGKIRHASMAPADERDTDSGKETHKVSHSKHNSLER